MTITYIRSLTVQPGIDRDGTNFSRVAYTDGEWVRFYRDKPRKIGGYKMILPGNDSIIRTMKICAIRSINDTAVVGMMRLFLGQYNAITISDINYSNAFSNFDVTPLTAESVTPAQTGQTAGYFLPNDKNLWNFDVMTINAKGTNGMILQTIVFAFVGQNASDISSTYQPTFKDPDSPPTTNNACVFYQIQNENSNSAFTPFLPLYVSNPDKPKLDTKTGFPNYPSNVPPSYSTSGGPYGMPTVSGGLCVAGPFLFLYGSNGLVMWSVPGDPYTFPHTQQASISPSKIVKGMPTRGGGTTSILFWSLTDVILAQFAPTSIPVPPAEDSSSGTINIYTYSFTFDTLRTDVSIMSANSVVEYNGNFYWIGTNQFYAYNGTVQALPNSMNKKYFFDGINPQYTSKVWGISNPQYDEITWYYPRGENIECSHSITYNIPGNFWYDSEISRSAGVSSSFFLFPLMADSGVNARLEYPKYGVWKHELGANAVYSNSSKGKDVFPIKSSFTTPPIMIGKDDPSNDVMLMTRRLEPDFRHPADNDYEKQTKTQDVDDFVNPMEFQILTKNYAQSPLKILKEIRFDKKTEYMNIVGAQGRQVQYKFISNIKDGSYQMGDVIVTFSAGDVRSG